jgi:hypothetical protein
MTGSPFDVRKTRKAQTTIGQLISALDDRNLLAAMRLLEPASESAERSPKDPDEAPRCVKCTTRGE